MSPLSEAAQQCHDSDKTTAELIARRFGKRGRKFDRLCATLASLVGSQPAVIRDWLVKRESVEDNVEKRLAAWVAVGMPMPHPPSVRPCRRLGDAPLKELSAVAAQVLGNGNRTALLVGAAAFASTTPAVLAARQAVASLHHCHKVRLLESLNRALIEAGQHPL